jgi:hypothetical protein
MEVASQEQSEELAWFCLVYFSYGVLGDPSLDADSFSRNGVYQD